MRRMWDKRLEQAKEFCSLLEYIYLELAVLFYL